MQPYLKAVWRATVLAALPLRGIEPLWGWAAVIVSLLILLGILAAGTYAFVAPQFDSPSWSPPLSPTQVGIGAISAVALLFFVASVRLQKRVDDRGRPLRTHIAGLIAMARHLHYPKLQTATSNAEVDAIKEEITAWRSNVSNVLSKSREDWAMRFLGAYASPEHLNRAPGLQNGNAHRLWAYLDAHIELLEEIYKEGSD